MTVLGIDAGHRDRSALERMVLAAVPDPILLCTHPVRHPQAHHAAALELDPASAAAATDALLAHGAAVAENGQVTGPDEHVTGALQALAAHRREGRAVRFPGRHLLRGTLTLAEAVATGAVDRIEPLGGPLPPETPLTTHDFVRPVYRGGELVLEVTPSTTGAVPFELEHQHICGH
ncbi:hypothetical protein DZF91_35105 [Actinomadura logoneensis]|uniref:Uncharacterized protein n=1 Tax=Actinomadura logoneensis TaxID=2293572 RepID=A0A372JAH5_9ACTN|nr:hypothetical protein [Actinomadura logoneensis]RFU37021.1 hypothetical protein DZF91_35105 [Actinomadura logoneensis]